MKIIDQLDNLKSGDTIKMLVDISNIDNPKYLKKGQKYKVKNVENSDLFASRFITLDNDKLYMFTENIEYVIEN